MANWCLLRLTSFYAVLNGSVTPSICPRPYEFSAWKINIETFLLRDTLEKSVIPFYLNTFRNTFGTQTINFNTYMSINFIRPYIFCKRSVRTYELKWNTLWSLKTWNVVDLFRVSRGNIVVACVRFSQWLMLRSLTSEDKFKHVSYYFENTSCQCWEWDQCNLR